MSSQELKKFTRTLKGILRITLSFKTVTGLLIRAPLQAQAYRIGGADQYPMVTRRTYGDVVLEVPYIPGSSIKGRMRSLLELSSNIKFYTTDKKIWYHARSLEAMGEEVIDDILNGCIIDELFGSPAISYERLERNEKVIEKLKRQNRNVDELFNMLTPTRLLVGDFFPSEDYVKREEIVSISDFLEEKSENRIDRITAAADPRSIVRVKPGVEFEGNVTLLIFDIDRDKIKEYLTSIASGLDLIEQTYLGGSGSRGYGRIKFDKIYVEPYKISTINGTPLRVPVKVKEEIKSFTSVEEFKSKIEELARELVENLF